MKENTDHRRIQAAALKYDPFRDDAPIIAALGMGPVAEKIIQTAEEHHVPVVEDKPLSDILSSLSVGDAIPPKLYEAVAHILVFISRKDGEFLGNLHF